ncbi:amidohydrolase family protein [Rubellimicrobium aerolatum]|uniref:Amidohydrolase family protein n=1 Tax=Rubellimicrobium aerolatum TaxID=490979 RepID=A0ABW0SC76_9RHOB|nr:amidohydrolase family protein [Rubellimicrobium aerolatum]MBP1806034.1 putative TIM-barrel fold metal-dependent hydrolase [Rubellimicrobium aerolatum]
MDLLDTHLHLIDRRVTGHAWTHRVPALQRDFPLEEALRLQDGRVRGAIFMEVAALDWQAESRWIAGLVREGRLLGQVANCRPETDDGFEAWLEEGPSLGVVGYRRILHEDVAEDVSLSGTFRANVRRIGRAGFPFDVNVRARTLRLARDLARACPDTGFVLDHCGTPDIAGGGWSEWSEGLREVAACPNMSVKLSGISAYAAPDTASLDVLRPWIDHVIETFTPARMVWGSDWPVVQLGLGMDGWIGLTEAVLGELSEDERASIAHRNAERIYGVRLPQH